MEQSKHKCLVISCGAIAKEVLALKTTMGLSNDVFELKCLPAIFHNYPDKIVPGLEEIIDSVGMNFERILIGYGDCGTGGGIDRMVKKYPNTERLPGAHCYAFYSGLVEFEGMMEEELGSFFLTDYLVRHFTTLVVKGFGIDRYPELKNTYFENYKRLIYLSQEPTAKLINEAKNAAEFLGLAYEHRPVGYGELKSEIVRFVEPQQEAYNV